MHQRSFDDLGTPLHEVTFCIVDLETTGGSPTECGITEIGAVKVRGGECLGTYQTLVNPGRAIPPEITVLTGITHAMVAPAPRIEAVLPSLIDFIGDAVFVGHNVRFDLGFVQAALARDDRARLANRSIDTVALARRLVVDEVPNCRLSTLARQFRLDHQPSHRALDDALATVDLLHLLLERAGRLGVTGLDDLLALPTIAGHAQVAKLPLTNQLPRSPGIYLFRDRSGRVLYVGKAANLRTRVRAYFSGERRRKVPQMLRETHRIDHRVCDSRLEAAVLEIRLIHELAPRYNRQGKTSGRYAYLKLTCNERFPRLSVVRVAKPDGGLYLGPLPSTRTARAVAEAIESVVPLRRCTARPPRIPRAAPCAPAQLGVSTCPCAGGVSDLDYAALVERVVRGLTREPDTLLGPLRHRMLELAAQERFEEAVDVRDRARALALAIRRQRRLDTLRRAGRVVLELPDGGAELRDGRLVRSWPGLGEALTLDLDAFDRPDAEPEPDTETVPVPLPLGATPLSAPVSRHEADELACVAGYLEAEAHRVRIVHTDSGLVSSLPRLPSFEPADGVRSKRDR
jgi:DNA polymerase-3 subunit epsilon